MGQSKKVEIAVKHKKSDLERPILVQIGFNKCATLSLTRLFNRSDVPSLHCNWSRGMNATKSQRPKPPYQVRIHRNLTAGRPAFDGLDRFSGFFDLEHIRWKNHYKNYRGFRQIAETYPNARFLLNTREKSDWIKSRARHSDGKYLKKYQTIYDETEEQVFTRWANEFDEHHQQVRSYFAAHPARLLEFHITNDDPQSIADFVAPDFTLDMSHWAHHHKTSDKIDAQGWQDSQGQKNFSGF